MISKASALFLSASITVLASCPSWASGEGDQAVDERRGAFELVKSVAEQTEKMDPQHLEELKTAVVEASQYQDENGFKKMADVKISTVYLTCALGEIALGAKGSLGVCLGTDNKVYTMGTAGGGLSHGLKLSLLMGFVKTEDGQISGTYVSGSIGRTGPKLLGASFVAATSDKDEKTSRNLFLAGASAGFMKDISLSYLVLTEVRK